jgi:hypothetical protein
MKHYSHITALPLSFFSGRLYQDVGQNWRGIGAMYLLLLAFVTWLPYAYLGNKVVQFFVDATAPAIVAQIPAIDLVQGKLSTEQAQPYFIKDTTTGKTVVIIDTTGRYTNLDHTPAMILITQDQIIDKLNNTKVKSHSLAQIKEEYHFNQQKINASLLWLKQYFWLISLLIGTLCFFILRLVQTLLCAIVGLIIANAHKRLHPFSRIMRLAAVAITPVAVLSVLLELFHIHFFLQGLVKVIIALAYLYFAITANSPINSDAERAPA